jgi:hypothetical protein
MEPWPGAGAPLISPCFAPLDRGQNQDRFIMERMLEGRPDDGRVLCEPSDADAVAGHMKWGGPIVRGYVYRRSTRREKVAHIIVAIHTASPASTVRDVMVGAGSADFGGVRRHGARTALARQTAPRQWPRPSMTVRDDGRRRGP